MRRTTMLWEVFVTRFEEAFGQYRRHAGFHGARRLPFGRTGAVAPGCALSRIHRADSRRAADGCDADPVIREGGHDYFANVAPALGRLLGIPGLRLDTRLTGLLAFIYSYHYLNWFIKAEVIRWNEMTKGRLALVGAASGASTALYFYDYAFGFTVLLAFSLAHIVLEFPVKSLALRQLASAAGTGVMKAVQRA
jgi:hypothetical protein